MERERKVSSTFWPGRQLPGQNSLQTLFLSFFFPIFFKNLLLLKQIKKNICDIGSWRREGGRSVHHTFYPSSGGQYIPTIFIKPTGFLFSKYLTIWSDFQPCAKHTSYIYMGFTRERFAWFTKTSPSQKSCPSQSGCCSPSSLLSPLCSFLPPEGPDPSLLTLPCSCGPAPTFLHSADLSQAFTCVSQISLLFTHGERVTHFFPFDF